MALDPRIALAGRGVDVGAAIGSGLLNADRIGSIRENKLIAGQNALLRPLQLQQQQQQVATGVEAQGDAQLQNFAQAAVLGIKAHQSGDVNGVARSIQMAFPDPARQQAELLEYRQNPEVYMQGAASALAQLNQRGQTASQREFAGLTGGLAPEDRDRAARIRLGLDPRATGSAAQTIADAGTAEKVGDSQAIIRQRAKFGELTGSSRAKAIDKGFDSIGKINKNVRNMTRAIAAIDEGASTGVIESRFFPSFKRSTLQLEALRKELALDVIGSVTFGALSQGELDLAQEVALPTNLEPEDLKVELQSRINAQEKLRGYYQSQIDHFDKGGTVASFLREQEMGSAGGGIAAPQVNQPAAQQAAPQVFQFDAQGNPI
jgi:hypothetical protein